MLTYGRRDFGVGANSLRSTRDLEAELPMNRDEAECGVGLARSISVTRGRALGDHPLIELSSMMGSIF
jgi:hypothetical protein